MSDVLGHNVENEMNDIERAEWLADKLHNGGDYGKEAAALLVAQATRLDWARTQLAKVNNEFGSETADWPDAWRRVAELKERAGRLWRYNEKLRAALTVVVRDWTEQFERNGHNAPAWVRQAREALGPNVLYRAE